MHILWVTRHDQQLGVRTDRSGESGGASHLTPRHVDPSSLSVLRTIVCIVRRHVCRRAALVVGSRTIEACCARHAGSVSSEAAERTDQAYQLNDRDPKYTSGGFHQHAQTRRRVRHARRGQLENSACSGCIRVRPSQYPCASVDGRRLVRAIIVRPGRGNTGHAQRAIDERRGHRVREGRRGSERYCSRTKLQFLWLSAGLAAKVGGTCRPIPQEVHRWPQHGERYSR